jgi:autotransporter-associated beta strand protein
MTTTFKMPSGGNGGDAGTVLGGAGGTSGVSGLGGSPAAAGRIVIENEVFNSGGGGGGPDGAGGANGPGSLGHAGGAAGVNGGGDGQPGADGSGSSGSGGGGGGFGQFFLGSLNNVHTVNGGDGGQGGTGIGGTSFGAIPAVVGGGGGGAGGFGLVVESPNSATIDNSGEFVGGKGGAGGVTEWVGGPGDAGLEHGGDGGDGGIGMFFLDNGVPNTIINSGTFQGGDGGAGGVGGISGHAGAGGEGIVGADLIITDSGKIAGGMSGDGVTQADAIDFIGGVNSLTLEGNYSIIGNVVAFSALDSLVLAGSTDNSLNVSQYQGFGIFKIVDSATWTLTGTTTADTPWTINSGVLAVSSDGNLGNDTNPTLDELTFNGGALKFLADGFSTGRQIVLNANGTFDTNGHNATLAGLISGDGGLIKNDPGVLTLFHSNAYSGGTFLNAGTLDLQVLGAAGAGQITFGAGAEILKIENAALSPLTSSLNSFGNPIQVTAVGDIIDLTGLTFDKHAKVSFDPKADILSVTSGGVTDNLTVVAPQGATFALSSDGANGTDVTLVGVAHTGHGHA